MTKSAVEFATDRRIHIGLAVSDIEKSAEFYRVLFGTPPSRMRQGYVRFEVVEPPLNLSLVETAHASGPSDPISHFGIQVKTADAIAEAAGRLTTAGLPYKAETATLCCHAIQDKVWATDPNGQRWEIYVVLDDAPMNEAVSVGVGQPADSCCSDVTATSCCPDATEPCCTGKSDDGSA